MIAWRRSRRRVWHAFAHGFDRSACCDHLEEDCTGCQPAPLGQHPVTLDGDRTCVLCCSELGRVRDRQRTAAPKGGHHLVVGETRSGRKVQP